MEIIERVNIHMHEDELRQVGASKKTLSKDGAKLKEVCNQFEQLLVKNLIDQMHSSAMSFGQEKSRESTVWQDMLNNEIAKEISRSDYLGISDILFMQLRESLVSYEDKEVEEIKDEIAEDAHSQHEIKTEGIDENE